MLLLAVLLINDLQVNFLDFGADKFCQEIGEYGEVVPRVEFSLLRLEKKQEVDYEMYEEDGVAGM